jgi:hypothetical protein
MMHAAEGCDIPYLSFDMDVSEKSADARGQMNSNELNKFRTTWCCKRYDHDAKLCRFAQMPMPMKIEDGSGEILLFMITEIGYASLSQPSPMMVAPTKAAS